MYRQIYKYPSLNINASTCDTMEWSLYTTIVYCTFFSTNFLNFAHQSIVFESLKFNNFCLD